jgi:hypothetical protein
MQVAKLTIPLSYNFVTFLSKEVYEKTIFFKFLGELLEKTAPGRWFDDLFPIVVLFPVVATLFGLYGRVKRVFVGIDVIEEDDENAPTYGTGSWREGRELIERELGGTATYRRRGDTASRVALAAPGGRAVPVLSIPAARDSGASPTRSPVPSANVRRPGQAARGAVGNEEEPEDDNMFVILGTRVKNTFEGIEAPKWFQDIKKPKWMGGDGDDTGSSQNNSYIRRWFGGDGQIRL